MTTTTKTPITVKATINAPLDKVWKCWTNPEHIIHWNYASDDWHTPKAINDLRPNGKFNYRMEAKDGSFGFDFEGTYTTVKNNELIEYFLDDGRKVEIRFDANDDTTVVTETFDPENENSLELQQNGWQAILNNFKKYTETV
ncbi:Activator of Hsp90 ATPase 1 family protein [Flavobacterium saliperosum S13]|uniref:Uncharacterized conserved protein YndB, AHSA1/START domain n=2 Tax=Flavobacterium saliperosum TaxID=329186 RepID=A0A1G4V1R8_9FLAO|nr:SRPBCC family protein [Flavobacterium saliperosum]ESU28585.1 Activator of Hsp90 ATPase 1 family protein [Flavobacterium saliperosum S13]SCW99877.1 Uncharacterized conserved protein YndB, AHSA1/START domain [Flavobacterium saliperosum]